MTQRDHPTVGRLAFYLIAAAAVTGAAAGWAFASGAAAWATEELNLPGWMPPVNLLVWLWIAKTLLLAYTIWATERFGRPGWRWLAILTELVLLAGTAVWVVLFLVLCDVTLGFLAIAAIWMVSIFAAWAAGKATRLAGVSLWPVLAWNTALLALTFEIMRLNTGQVGQIAGFGLG
ncbi:tryptophan-rich sensory protein [Hyphobacterium marinum]|uniref:Tryptophan-rich sensory protein n=1 Tax=Hyphobacterium marinum TaxID=3116574 RepID=A0ABU7LVC6_9PROT|nr:tryptophan-rich sensory protein [Hyphobacterium sp. Y6023]MEE2565511.1 tryptophan-rich sensory protein [Hyphobacterium sp. Y6023]